MSSRARADQYDFIAQLDNRGVYYESMIDIGNQLCAHWSSSCQLLRLESIRFCGSMIALVLDNPRPFVGSAMHMVAHAPRLESSSGR
ncbi:hypothetical protein [Mycolicibacterium gadium]|uniref:hypothetical protein n=1 Tax=Mycolicibacterium gadium TaxID=1794 RepID=UPI001F24EDD4|nr:hypothetical protein [Mycolicibacterium gadium]